MQAGFARVSITPPKDTIMMGFAARDRQRGCEGVHDEIYVRALYLEHEGERALVLGFDLCFLDREVADRLLGALGRRLDMTPRQMLLNASHTHAGPASHRWAYGDFTWIDRLYMRQIEAATVGAAREARDRAVEVTLRAGVGRSRLPVSRRKKDPDGRARWAPAPESPICDALPVCLFEDDGGAPVCLLFSVSCHPSSIGGFLISADYPGSATAAIDEALGAPVSLFLQGCGGDAKPRFVAAGDRWRKGNWEDVAAAGALVAKETLAVVKKGLRPVEPRLRTAALEMQWPLQPAPNRAAFQRMVDHAGGPKAEMRTLWAERQMELLGRDGRLPTHAPINCHLVQVAENVRLVGLEGEPVAELGDLILDHFGRKVTFPLGYTDGAQLYLPTSPMLDEGGYETDSYWEYGYPSRLAKGMEGILRETLGKLSEEP